MRVLLVEDNEETVDFVSRGLSEAGDTVTVEMTAQAGLLTAAGKPFDVIIFDRLLPGMDGLDAVRVLRKSNVQTPILMLTALAGINDRVDGLEAGADDYLVKPFAFAELYARLKALARRQPLAEEEITHYEIADLKLDRLTQTVTRSGEKLDLLPREYRILEFLMQHEGELITRTMLLENIWGYNFDPKTSLVQTHMSRLRSKIDKPFSSDLIQTVRGSGYVIAPPQ
ncbi:MAG: response regulator transcription factor [Pseudomonadota bacterium]